MKKTVNLFALLAMVLTSVVSFYSCSKESVSASSDAVPTGKQNVSLYLSDGPGFFDKVLIDIQSVQVLVDTCANAQSDRDRDGDRDHDGNSGWHDTCAVWQSLNVSPGIYDLLTLRNGADTLLAGSTIPAGKILTIKIQLGPNDSLVKDSVTYPLKIKDSTVVLVDASNCKWDEFKPKHFRLWLDFDVSRSIVNVWNNEFFLAPFIRLFTVNTTASISGEVMPREAFPVISVINSSDTAYALPDRNGHFKIRGLNAGTYNVSINASNGYADTTISGITVAAGQNINIGNIQLHK